ncbi:hypothetical protein pb186bvf_007705 [Paramecium bursaria]
MDQLVSYQFRRGFYTNDVQQIYLASEGWTMPNDVIVSFNIKFFKNHNVNKDKVIKVFPGQVQTQMDDYIELLDTEAQMRNNILFQFNNQTKDIVIDIIIQYLQHQDRINVNGDLLSKLRKINPETQSELMPPTESIITQSPSNLGPPTQINSEINQQIILEPLPVFRTYGLTQQR